MLRIVLVLVVLFILVYVLLCLWPLYFWPLSKGKARVTFPRDYFIARKHFLEKAKRRGGEIESHQVKATGPENEPLFIDFAWIGPRDPKQVLLHISGTHGVEGYAGSAIQMALIDEGIVHDEETAVVFLHALNPYGMAHLRRVNESNVDLNRNFYSETSRYQGVPDSYKAIEEFLNPKTSPTRVNLFLPKTIYNILRFGFAALKQAIAGGQYEFEKGIYFGGKKLEESLVFLREWMVKRFANAEVLYVVEVHTGLGDYGNDTFFWPLAKEDERTTRIETALDITLDSDAPDEGIGFRTAGDLQGASLDLLPDVEVNWILQEFGTYHPVRMLWALRDENSYHHYGQGSIDHWSKYNMLNAFVPFDPAWEDTILERGVTLPNKILKYLQD